MNGPGGCRARWGRLIAVAGASVVGVVGVVAAVVLAVRWLGVSESTLREWAKTVTDLLRVIVWPVVVVFSLRTFRAPITELIGRVRQFEGLGFKAALDAMSASAQSVSTELASGSVGGTQHRGQEYRSDEQSPIDMPDGLDKDPTDSKPVRRREPAGAVNDSIKGAARPSPRKRSSGQERETIRQQALGQFNDAASELTDSLNCSMAAPAQGIFQAYYATLRAAAAVAALDRLKHDGAYSGSLEGSWVLPEELTKRGVERALRVIERADPKTADLIEQATSIQRRVAQGRRDLVTTQEAVAYIKNCQVIFMALLELTPPSDRDRLAGAERDLIGLVAHINGYEILR